MARLQAWMKSAPLAIKLLLVLSPLLIGIGSYWLVWNGFRQAFQADVAHVLKQTSVPIGGFPYRLEAVLGPGEYRREVPGLRTMVSFTQLVLNRGPWQRNLTVMRGTGLHLDLSVPVSGVSLDLVAATGQASLNLQHGQIVRLSTVFDAPQLRFGLLPVPLTAESFEMHLRELPQAMPANTSTGAAPTPPAQVQLVLVGKGARLGGGDALQLTADFALTASEPLRSFAAWADGGTIELTTLTITDATGEVLRATATAVPMGGQLQIAGTVTTVCPETLRAAVAGTTPPHELRTRMPVRIALTKIAAGPVQLEPEGGWGPRPVRGQQPACPALRR